MPIPDKKDNLNLYGYCKDDPVTGSDAQGLWTLYSGSWLDGEAGVIGGGLGYGFSIDQHLTVSFWLSGQGQLGFGEAAEGGREWGVSPGNTYVGSNGFGASGYLQPGAGGSFGCGPAGEAQYNFGRPAKNSTVDKWLGWLWQSTPGASISPSVSGSFGRRRV